MTQDDIIRMAREAGLSKVVRAHPDGTMTIEMPHPDKLERFAALVAAYEREACAKVCDEHGFYGAAPARDIRARGK